MYDPLQIKVMHRTPGMLNQSKWPIHNNEIWYANVAVLIFLVTLICANSFVKICDLMLFIHELTKTQCFLIL